MSEDCVSRLVRMVSEQVARNEKAGLVAAPRPQQQVLLVARDSDYVSRERENFNDWPEMSQDDWRDQLNPNEGCK